MVDFVKFQIMGMLPEAIGRHPDLTFNSPANPETGEVDTSIAYSDYKGLRFYIYSARKGYKHGIITLEGSLHKFWNEGRHNYNDFGIEELDEVICELYNRFNLHPTNLLLRNIEFGVNISPPDDTDKIIDYCLLHKTTPFKWVFTKKGGNYKQVKRENYVIKIYNKQAQYIAKYNVPPTLRFEIKFTRMRDLNKTGIYTMQDLLQYGFDVFKARLLKEWENVLFYDYNVFDGTKYSDRYSNEKFWRNLNPSTFKYHRTILNRRIKTYLNSNKRQIAEAIDDKCKWLMKLTDRMPTYNIMCK